MYMTLCERDGQCKSHARSKVPKASALGQPSGMGCGGRWEGDSVHLWPIHAIRGKDHHNTAKYHPPIKINQLKKYSASECLCLLLGTDLPCFPDLTNLNALYSGV